MNDLTRIAIRNVELLAAWYERWRNKTGSYPLSRNQTAPVDINDRASAARKCGCFADEIIAPVEHSADVLIHPSMFERHGNGNVRKIRRHRHQITAKLPEPPEAE